jgi:hypothetical protein
MTIQINIQETALNVFESNLTYTFDELLISCKTLRNKLVGEVIKTYLNECINRDDLDMFIAQYLDSLQESGELEDIIFKTS